MKLRRLLFVFVVLVFIFLRISDLGFDISDSDSARWHKRSEAFLDAIKSGDLMETYQHYQPGVTIMWIGAASLKLLDNDPDRRIASTNAKEYAKIHRNSRLILIIALVLLLILMVWVLNNLLGYKVALLFGLLSAIEPYLNGIDRFFHVTSLENYLAFSSFLLVWLWYKKENKVLLMVGAFLFGLALLTKTTAVIAFAPILVFLAIKLRQKNYGLVVFVLITVWTYASLFPALLCDPSTILSKIMGGVKGGISLDTREAEYQGMLAILYYPIVLAFKLSPWVLALGALAILKKPRSLLPILGYVFAYFFALTLSVKKIDRYSLSFFLPALLLASIQASSLNQKLLKWLLVVVSLATVLIIYVYHPVYSAFYEPLFGSSRGASFMQIYTNSGQYYSYAAEYLNSSYPHSAVVVPYNKEAFYYLFDNKGDMQERVTANTSFIVTSFNKLDNYSLPKRCRSVEKELGSKLETIVYVFRCGPT